MLVFTFYFTCILSGIIELGAILWGIGNGYSIQASLALAISYQLGNVFLFLINEKIRKCQSYFLGLFAILAIIMQFPVGNTIKYIIAFILFSGLSTAIQTMRSAVKSKEPRWRKRCFRVLGFVLSAVMYDYGTVALLVISVILFILSLITPKFKDSCWLKKLLVGEYGENKICMTMVVHQMHYFVYCYAMLIIAYEFYKTPWIATLWFVGNWVPYIITEPLIKKSKKDNWMLFLIAGHVLVAGLLLAMYVSIVNSNVPLAMLLWVFTGFGGGNVFCIKKSLKPVKEYDNMVWVFSENVGHILGVIVVTLLVSISTIHNSLLLGVFCAVLTVLFIKITYERAKKIECNLRMEDYMNENHRINNRI